MPTPWEKMNVKLAAQLLSETVGMHFLLRFDHYRGILGAAGLGRRRSLIWVKTSKIWGK